MDHDSKFIWTHRYTGPTRNSLLVRFLDGLNGAAQLKDLNDLILTVDSRLSHRAELIAYCLLPNSYPRCQT
jgi:hypothetical protein